MLEAGDDKFCDATDDELAGFACGEVLTESGDVNPELFELIVLLFVAWLLLVIGGVLLAGAAPVVLRSCGEATPVDEVETSYLQLALEFKIPGLCAPEVVWCRCVELPPNLCGCSWV